MIMVKYLPSKIAEMCDAMKVYIKENNLHAAVLGISGGIDSTLVAALLSRVSEELSREEYSFKFYGVSLPTKTTVSSEFWASQLVGRAFCDEFSVVEMEKVSECLDRWVESDPTQLAPLRSGNIKSRLRMIYLYDLAKKTNGLVIGTDNVSEYLLGFSTIGGDALFDYNPIQDLWKSDVFAVSEYLLDVYASKGEYDKANALQRSLALKPMDGLGISFDDMVQIGARNYYDVDDILQWYLRNGKPAQMPESILSSQDGHIIDNKTITRVIDRHKNSEFKRRKQSVNIVL